MRERMEADPEMEELMEMRNEWSREQRRRVASALIHAAAFPGIRVDRARFLSEALKKQCPTRNVWEAVASTLSKSVSDQVQSVQHVSSPVSVFHNSQQFIMFHKHFKAQVSLSSLTAASVTQATS